MATPSTLLTARVRSTTAFYAREARRLARLSETTQDVYYAQQYYDGAKTARAIYAAFKRSGDLTGLLAYFRAEYDKSHGIPKSWYAEARADAMALVLYSSGGKLPQ